MTYSKLNGTDLEKMVRNGYNNLKNNEEYLNSLNVFPVADGDTGTNMRLTVENGIKNASSTKSFCDYLNALSTGMLFGARGNSGVILSQLIKGLSTALEGDGIVNLNELKQALVSAYKTAYTAVIHPVEGTILTVSREGIENILYDSPKNVSIENFLTLYLNEMRNSLSKTPNLLPALKDAGVVDSGAFGYIILIEGMVKSLLGEIIILKDNSPLLETATTTDFDNSSFDENSEFSLGYCMEFLLQLMNAKNDIKLFNLDGFIESLNSMGNSLVAVQNGSIVKVHIHTFNPSTIITLSQKYGEFISFKLENMQLQHNEFNKSNGTEETTSNKIPFGIITVANGEGIKDLFSEMGSNLVIDGGKSINTSTEEFIQAVKKVNSEQTVILPNNSNILKSAVQAIELASLKNVTVIPTSNFIEGYYALAMDNGAIDDYSYRIEMIKDGANSITSLEIASAVKSYKTTNFSCEKNDKIAFINHKPVVATTDILECVILAFKKVENVSEKSNAIIFKGIDFPTDKEDELTSLLENEFPSLEISVIDGGQPTYELLIGLI